MLIVGISNEQKQRKCLSVFFKYNRIAFWVRQRNTRKEKCSTVGCNHTEASLLNHSVSWHITFSLLLLLLCCAYSLYVFLCVPVITFGCIRISSLKRSKTDWLCYSRISRCCWAATFTCLWPFDGPADGICPASNIVAIITTIVLLNMSPFIMCGHFSV